MESKINQVQVAYQQFYTSIGIENVWKGFLDGAKSVIDTLNSLPKLFGTIPVGAIAMVTNIISLIKTVVLQGFGSIATNIETILQEANGGAANTAQAGGANIGATWGKSVAEAIRASRGDIQGAMDEALKKNPDTPTNAGQGNAPASKLNIPILDNILNSNKKYDKDSDQEDEGLQQLRTAYLEYGKIVGEIPEAVAKSQQEIEKAYQAGTINLGQAAHQIRDNFNQSFTQVAKDAQKIPEGIEQAVSKVEKNKSFISNLGSNISKQFSGLGEKIASSLSKAFSLNGDGSGYKIIGQLASTVSALISKETEEGIQASGVINGLGGVSQAFGGALQLASGNVIAGIQNMLTGVINIFNGWSTAWITDEERLEILTKQAETLNNEAKKAKAEYNTLDNSIKKIDELEEKRYDSEEAAQAYQDAINELTNQFPQLIAGFDASGNAILDTVAAEEMLANARIKSAQASYEAAKGEYKVAAQQATISRQTAESALPSYLDTITTNLNVARGGLTGYIQNQLSPYEKILQDKGKLTPQVFTNESDREVMLASLDRLNNVFDNYNEVLAVIEEYRQLAPNEKIDWNDFDAALENATSLFKGKDADAEQQIYEYIQKIKDAYDNSFINLSDSELETAEQINKKIEDYNKSDNHTVETGTQLINDINKLIDNNGNLYSYYEPTLNYLKQYNELLEQAGNDIRAQEIAAKKLATTWQNIQFKDIADEFEYLADNSALSTILSNRMAAETTSVDDISANQQKWYQYMLSAEGFWNSLNDEYQSLFNQMLQDSKSYSAKDILSMEEFQGMDDELVSMLNEYYSDRIQNIRTRLVNQFKQIENGTSSNFTYLYSSALTQVDTEDEATYLSNVLQLWQDYQDSGLGDIGESVGLAYMRFYSQLQQLTPQMRNTALDIINSYGFKTISGIEQMAKALQQADIDLDLTELENVKSEMITNIPLELQAATDSILKEWPEKTKKIGQLLSDGLSSADLDSFLDELSNLNIDINLDKDIKWENGKATISTDKVKEYVNAVTNLYDNLIQSTQQGIDGLRQIDLDSININQNTGKVDKNNDFVELLKSFGININDYIKESIDETTGAINSYTLDKAALKDTIQTKLDDNQIALNRFAMYQAQAIDEFNQMLFNAGDYSSIGGPGKAAQLARGDLKPSKPIEKQAQKTVREVYDSLISDVLNKGFDEIDLSDYTGLLNKNALTNVLKGSYQKFVKSYIDLAHKTIEEYNDLMIQAIEKDAKADRQNVDISAAKSALDDLTFTGKGTYGSLDQIKNLANSLNMKVDELIGGYIEELDQYSVDLSRIPADKIAQIKNSESLIADSVNEFLQSIVDAIGNGIQGKLTYQGRDELIAQLGQLGINSITAADFTQTADGLKLSVDAAYELYKVLSQIDTYKGQLVFDELYDSLTQTGEACENILTTMASIATAEGNLGKVSNGDLQERLNLYRQIARVQMDNSDSYKFMDNKLPTGMQGAVNFYNDWAEAAKTIKSSSASGYMGMQDFYNIINEINNMAAISGEIKLGAYTLDGNLSSAANLIQDAFNSLEMVDGKGMMVKLSGIGADFSFAGADFSDGVNSGLQDFAQSQIDMLDGMIQMLETIVAMENITEGISDSNENGEIDFSEMFPKIRIDEDGNEWAMITPQLMKNAKHILKLAETNEDLQKALSGLNINGLNIGEMLKKIAKGGEISKEDAELFHATVLATQQALESGEYDLDNLQTSILSILAKSGIIDEYTINDKTYAIGYGFHLEKTENGWEYNGKIYDTSEEALAAMAGEQDIAAGAVETTLTTKSGETVKAYEFDAGAFKYTKHYSKGEIIYTATASNGEQVTANSESELRQQLVNIELDEWENGQQGNVTEEQLQEKQLELNQKYGIKIQATVDTSNATVTGIDHNTYKALREKVSEVIENNGKVDDSNLVTELEQKVGFKIELDETGSVDEATIQKLQTFFNMEDKHLNLTIESVQGDDVEWLKQLLESKDTPIPITATISVTNGKGEAGGEGGGITADGTYSIDTIQLAATAIQLVQGEGGKPTVDAAGLGTLLTGAIYLATQLATLIPGDAFSASVDGLPLDNIPLQQAILNVINILLDAAESKVNDVGVVAAAKANPSSIDNLTATVLALLLAAAPGAVDPSELPLPESGSTLAEHIGLLKAWVDSILVNASDADVNNSGVKAQVKSIPVDVETITAIVNDILAQLGVDADPQGEMSALIPDDVSTDKNLSVNVTPKYQLAPGAHTPTEEELNTLLGISNLPPAQRDENGYIIWPGTQTRYQGQGPEYTPPTEQNAQEVIINGNNVEVNGENSNTPAPSDNTNTAGQFEGAAQAAQEAATEMSGAADTVTTVSIDAKAAVAQTQSDIQSSAEQIESTAADVAAKTAELGSAAESASGNVENLVGAINSIPSNTEIGIGVSINVDVSSQTGFAPVTSATIHAPISNKPVAAKSKGNVALSKGRKTLMGELGPELVVSHGRYYVVGENGAEFVDLDDDAIVFNHLQTKRLLQNGITSRGAPITNERNAVSFATGTQGPALASAAQALAQLKQIRAMWESMLTATLSSLGKQAGSGSGKGKGGGGGKGKSGDGSGSSGGGGGGGGGGEDDKEVNAAYIADLERWYNLLRQIAKLEQDITYEEQLRSKIESDRVINGSALYESRKRQLDQLDQEIAKNKELSALQKSYYDARRKDLESTNFGKIFTFDENGLMQWNDNAVMANGQRGGLFALEELNRMDEYGRPAYTARQQYEMLKSWGFSAEMEYDNNGNKIELEDINDEEGYAKMVQAFNDRMDGWKDELDSLYDSYNEQLEKATSNETKRNELLQQIVDNQLSVEKSVLGAIEAREKAVIDELKNEQTALKESTDAYLDGLNRQLDQEKQLYARQDQDQELTRLQRQLAILQRTGGSASQIRSLQNEIANKSQDRYFDLQQEQIDAVKDAAEKQQEQLDQQIKIMEETLEYQKENGLLWAEVAQVMQGTPQEITAFIAQYTPSYRSNSELQIAEDLRKLTGEVEDWVAYRDDEDEKVSTALAFPWESFVESTNHRYDELLSGEVGIIARAMFDELYSQTGDSTKSGIAVLEWLEGTYGPGAPQELTPEQEAAQAEAQKTKEWAQELYEELLGISQITGPNTQAQMKKALSETGFNKNDILKILETYYADVIALGLGPDLLQGNGTQKDYDSSFALQNIVEKYFKNKYGDSDTQVSAIIKDMLPLLQRLAEGSTYRIDLINNSTYTPDVQLGTLMNPYWGNMSTELESLVTTLRPTAGGSFPESKYLKQIMTDWLMKQWKTWQAPGVAIKKQSSGDRRLSGAGDSTPTEPYSYYTKLSPVLQTQLVGSDGYVYVDTEGNIYKIVDNDISKDIEARAAGYTGGLVMTKEQYDAWMSSSSVYSASQANQELEHLKAVYGATSISDLKGLLGSNYKLPSGYTLSEVGGAIEALGRYDTAFNTGLNVGTLNAEINITTTDANVGQEVVDALNAAMQKTARRVP